MAPFRYSTTLPPLTPVSADARGPSAPLLPSSAAWAARISDGIGGAGGMMTTGLGEMIGFTPPIGGGAIFAMMECLLYGIHYRSRRTVRGDAFVVAHRLCNVPRLPL